MANFYTTKLNEIKKQEIWKSRVVSHTRSGLDEIVCGICHEIAVLPVNFDNIYGKKTTLLFGLCRAMEESF